MQPIGFAASHAPEGAPDPSPRATGIAPNPIPSNERDLSQIQQEADAPARRMLARAMADADCSEESIARALGRTKSYVAKRCSGSRPWAWRDLVALAQRRPAVVRALSLQLAALADRSPAPDGDQMELPGVRRG
jgi:hypothetical protein